MKACGGLWALAVLVALGVTAAAAEESRVVVPDQCPGKYCHFGPWTLEDDARLVTAPRSDAPDVGVVVAGTLVEIVTGEVHAVPGVFLVHREHGSYRPGDRLRVLSYLGGGEWLVEVDGRRFAEDLGFSPWGGAPGLRCEVREHCWGTLQASFDWSFWAKIEAPDGTSGWSKRWDTRQSKTPFEVPH